MSISNVIFTMPSQLDLLKSLREDIDAYITVINYYDKDYSIAKIFSVPRIVSWGKDWKIFRKKIRVKTFRRYTPSYPMYMEKRERMTLSAIEELERLLNTEKKKRKSRQSESPEENFESWEGEISDSEQG